MLVNKAVALRISELLEKKKITQYRLEINSGILHGTMSGIMAEKNKTVNLSTVVKIARGFNMTLQKFLNSPL